MFLSKISRLVSAIRKDASELPMQILDVFLCVAADEGIGAAEVMQRLGMARSSTSRNLNQLADGVGANGSNNPLNWLEWRLSKQDARSKIYFLTPKGREVLSSWAASLEEHVEAGRE